MGDPVLARQEVTVANATQVVEIPDSVLASWIRELLDLSEEEDITALDMGRLRVLSDEWGDKEIHSLEGLQYAIHLETLYVPNRNNQISDITPLENLSYLTSASIFSPYIDNFSSSLSEMMQLRTLRIGGGAVSDDTVATISNLTNLLDLSITYAQLSDITPLANLEHLFTLYLWNNEIEDISPLSNLLYLEDLGLNNNKISDITPLSNLQYLRGLSLEFNNISDVTPLSNMQRHLKQLYLTFNEISDVTPLANLQGLTTLYLDFNRISDMTPLSNLPSTVLMNLSYQIIELHDVELGQGTEILIRDKDGSIPELNFLTDGSYEDNILTWNNVGDNGLIFTGSSGTNFSGSIYQQVK